MARPTGIPWALGLALLCLTTVATAANPLGMAVAGAPSMFVLAVAQARSEGRDSKADEREPRAEAAEQARQAAAEPAPQPRSRERAVPDERQLTLR